jgi:hypothetical protein
MSVRRLVKHAAPALMAVLPLVLVDCADDPVAPGTRITEVRVTVISGDRQAAEVGTRLPEPIVVRVNWVYEDGTTAPAAGQEVVAVDPSCWDLGLDCPRAASGTATHAPWATTDSAGEARTWWDLHTRAKQYTIKASWRKIVGPDCSPVCAESVQVTGDTVRVVAYPGPSQASSLNSAT